MIAHYGNTIFSISESKIPTKGGELPIVNQPICSNELDGIFNNPHSVSWMAFDEIRQLQGYVFSRPNDKTLNPATLVDTMASLPNWSKSEVYRKVKEGAIKWNGKKVVDAKMELDFLFPGWGIIKFGKKTYFVVLDSDFWIQWKEEEPPYDYFCSDYPEPGSKDILAAYCRKWEHLHTQGRAKMVIKISNKDVEEIEKRDVSDPIRQILAFLCLNNKGCFIGKIC